MSKLAGINAIIFFFFWLLVLLAGADKPPPVNFLWLIQAVALCALVVYWRITTYINWAQTQKPGRLPRVVLEGFMAGLAIAIPFAVLGSGEPSVTPQPLDYLGWFVVAGIVGLLNAVALYAINSFVAGKVSMK